MPILVLFLFRFARLLFNGHAAIAVENAALRLQLTAFQRKRKRPVLTSCDRLFWGRAFPVVDGLARSADLRSSRHGRPLAA
jgi:hypothetical protein